MPYTPEKRKLVLQRNKNFIDGYKNEPCLDCRVSFPTYVMEFDHISNKKYNVNQLRYTPVSLETILNEMNNCEVVCRNCHRIRSFNRLLRNPQSKNNKQKKYLYSIINTIKSQSACMDCGKFYHQSAMDFDHLFDKIAPIAEMIRNKKQLNDILNEISKCDLVCANCHTIRSHRRLSHEI